MLAPLRACVIAACIAILSGCATAPPPSTQWQAHQSALTAIDSYTAKGKVAFISPQERFSANLYWHHQPEQSTLRLTNFLGTTLLSLTIDPQRATVVDDQGQVYTDSDAARLIERLSGMSLPIDALPAWLLGLPQSRDQFELGDDNRLARLSNAQGWTIDYLGYDGSTQPALPSRITLKSPQQTVKLVISNWTLDDE